MGKIDRTIAPKLGEMAKLIFPPIHIEQLSNNIQVTKTVGCSQPVCSITMVIKRGTYVAKDVFTATATANLLCEGTEKYPGLKLPEMLDFYGITVSPVTTLFDTRITVKTLSKHITVAIELLAEMILHPEFSEENFANELEQSIEGLKISSERVNYLAHKAFIKLLFGKSHKFARLNSLKSVKNVTIEELRLYHQTHYKASNFQIYLAGDVPQNATELLDLAFGKLQNSNHQEVKFQEVKTQTALYTFTKKSNATQSAIFMGKSLIAHNHEDYPSLYFLNVVLGGYFGSRLMSKLREEMGITYGINSYIVPRKDAAELYISTEVKSERTQEAVLAIKEVINHLQTSNIDQEELKNVRNYIFGNMASFFDSSFAVTNQLITLDFAGSKLDNFNKIIEKAHTITPEEIREMAIRYLDTTKMVCSVSGNPNCNLIVE